MAAVPFALSPAQAIRGLADHRSSQGLKVCEGATAKLSDKLFDCTSDKLFPFLKTLANRAVEHGWEGGTGTLSLEAEDSTPEETRHESLLESCRQIALERIKNHEEACLRTQCRAAQDNCQL